MRKLKGLRIKGYKAIQDISLTDLADINYLVGANGSGKSSIFEALSIPSIFIKRGSTGTSAVSMYGDLNRIIHDDFYFEVNFNDEVINIVVVKVHDHHNLTIQDGDYIRCYPEGNPTRETGLHSQDWIANILDMNTTTEEESIELKSNYTFSLDNADDPEAIRTFLNEHYHYTQKDEYVRNVVRSITPANTIELEITKLTDKSETLRYESLRGVSSGYLQLLALYFSIRRKLRQYADQAMPSQRVAIVCIEEPGQGLHPGLQKKLPALFNKILEDENLSNIVLLVTTHSPFIISAACNQKKQKTYLIKDGHAVNLAGDPEEKSSGYDSNKCLDVAARMLDAGFEDLALTPSTKESVQIVYCEGSAKKVKDSDIYSEIFGDEPMRRVFISTGGFTDAFNAYYAARASAKFVFGEGSNAIALVDRSCSSSDIPISLGETVKRTSTKKIMFTDEERTKILHSDTQLGYRILKRKEIENYLFDPMVTALMPKPKQSIWKEGVDPSSIDYEKGEVKDYLKADADKMEAARLIRQHRDTATKKLYQELIDCLTAPE